MLWSMITMKSIKSMIAMWSIRKLTYRCVAFKAYETLVWVPYPVSSFLYFVISVNKVWHGKGSQVGNLTLGMSHSSQNVSMHLLSSKYNCLSVFLVIYKTSTFYMHQKYLQIALLLTRRSTFSLRRKVGDWVIFFWQFRGFMSFKI